MRLRGAVVFVGLAVVLSSCSAFGDANPPQSSPTPTVVVSTVTVSPAPSAPATEIVQVDPFEADGNVKDTYNVDNSNSKDDSGFFPVGPDECTRPSYYGSSPGTYSCETTALSADACWLTQGRSLLCTYLPWDRKLYSIPLKVRPETTPTTGEPAPLAMELADGSRYRARNSAGNSTRSDGLQDVYSCVEGPCMDADDAPWVLGSDKAPVVNQKADAWTVLIGANSGKPKRREVRRAWFISAE